MIARKAWVGAVLTSGLFASALDAQSRSEPRTGSYIGDPERARIDERPGLSAVDRGRLAMEGFARCTLDHERQGVSRYLSAITAGERADVRRLAADDCLASGTMSFMPSMMRGAIFVELERRREIALSKHQSWLFPVPPLDDAPVASSNTPDTVLRSFAQCVIHRDPVKARAVVLAPAATKVQNAAYAALLPELAPCVSQGQKLDMSKSVLEGAFAEVLYRESGAAAQVAKTGN